MDGPLSQSPEELKIPTSPLCKDSEVQPSPPRHRNITRLTSHDVNSELMAALILSPSYLVTGCDAGLEAHSQCRFSFERRVHQPDPPLLAISKQLLQWTDNDLHENVTPRHSTL